MSRRQIIVTVVVAVMAVAIVISSLDTTSKVVAFVALAIAEGLVLLRR